MTREEKAREFAEEIIELSRIIKHLRRQRSQKKFELQTLQEEIKFITATKNQKEFVPKTIIRNRPDNAKTRMPECM